jgi:bifunctional DNA-binding transcriptional regulator/antitoxin component of YhaV-PrlF toxin-antitoxin module
MQEATLTSKSQLTLPKTVRDAMGVGAGDRIRFVPSRNGFRIVAMKGDIRKLRGIFKGRRAKPVTIEEMNNAIAQMGARRGTRKS